MDASVATAQDAVNTRRKIVRDTVLLNAASILSQGLLFLQSLVVMGILDPAAYGIWLSLTIFLAYGGYAHFGLEHGIGLKLPYYRARGEMDRAKEAEDTAYFFWTLASLLFGVAVLLYALLVPQPSAVMRWGLLALAGMLPLTQQTLFYARWQSAAKLDFSKVSMANALRSVSTFCLAIPLAYLLNVEGVMLAAVLTTGVVAAYWWSRSSYRYGGHRSVLMLHELLRVGFPILMIVIGGTLIRTVDRLLILGYLGTEALGFYGVTALGGNLLYGLISQAGSAMSPHVLATMGRTNDAPEALKPFLVKPTLIFAHLIAGGILVLAFVVPPFVQLWLPRYLPGLNAFYLFIPGFFFLGITLSANNLLNGILMARRRQRIAIWIQVAAVAIELGVGFLMIRGGMGIAGVALASTVAYAAYGIAIIVATTAYILPDARARAAFMLRTLVPLGWATVVGVVVYALGVTVLGESPIVALVVQPGLAGLLYLPLLLLLLRDREIRETTSGLVASLRRRVGPSR
jgi:O-antigen/teichoic acid export membrane protein